MITYTLNEYGLRPKDIAYMHAVFSTKPEIEKVILYGSRAKGTFQHGSDIDLALVGTEVSDNTVTEVHYLLEEESPTLLFFDVLNYSGIKNPKLKDEIDYHGKVIYQAMH